MTLQFSSLLFLKFYDTKDFSLLFYHSQQLPQLSFHSRDISFFFFCTETSFTQSLDHCQVSLLQISGIFVFRQERPWEIWSLCHCGPLIIGSIDLLVSKCSFPPTLPWGPIHLICGHLKQRLNLDIQPVESCSADSNSQGHHKLPPPPTVSDDPDCWRQHTLRDKEGGEQKHETGCV